MFSYTHAHTHSLWIGFINHFVAHCLSISEKIGIIITIRLVFNHVKLNKRPFFFFFNSREPGPGFKCIIILF